MALSMKAGGVSGERASGGVEARRSTHARWILFVSFMLAATLSAGSLVDLRRSVAVAQDTSEASETAPEPVEVEAGVRIGPIRIGMTEAEVRALGLPESPVDPRSRRFGPFRVFFDERGVRRVEARMGDLVRIRLRDTVLDVGTHIHRLRDVIGDCQWQEGGGERYRCSGGALSVQTSHSMDPSRYMLAVERR